MKLPEDRMTSNTNCTLFLEDVFYRRKFLEPTERFHELKIDPDVKVRLNNLTILSGHESSGSATEVKLKFLC